MKVDNGINSQSASFCRVERNSTNSPVDAPHAVAGPGHELIKLAIDAHGKFHMVARQVDNAVAQPPQKFDEEQLLRFIAKQTTLAKRVVCCYEAGCFGFVLHRRITGLGAENLVVAPQDWDERKQGVKTDRTDSLAMLSRLDRYAAGNLKALAVVRVPGEAEEVHRSRVRQRKQFQSDRNRWANQGKSLLLQYGLKLGWSWWKPERYEKVQAAVRERMGDHAATILSMLADNREILLKVNETLDALTKEQRQAVRLKHKEHKPLDRKECEKKEPQKECDQEELRVSVPRLKGFGELSLTQIDAEVGDWHRFHNRRQVSSYTGLCPGVSGSGGKFTELSVTKCGNQRLRAALVELAWLIARYQKEYGPAVRCRLVLSGKNRSAKKKAIVALARKLAVDLWRLSTGRTTPEKLKLELSKAA